jgi:hypothetical protein
MVVVEWHGGIIAGVGPDVGASKLERRHGGDDGGDWDRALELPLPKIAPEPLAGRGRTAGSNPGLPAIAPGFDPPWTAP